MNLDLESPSGAALFPRREPASLILSDPIDLRRRRPVLAAHTRTRQHRDDIEELLSALRAGRPYDRPAERSATFLFVKRGDLYGIALRLGEATEKLLRLCDGTHEAGEIIERFKGGPGGGPDGGAAGVERMLVKLAYDRVILL